MEADGPVSIRFLRRCPAASWKLALTWELLEVPPPDGVLATDSLIVEGAVAHHLDAHAGEFEEHEQSVGCDECKHHAAYEPLERRLLTLS